jgi:hypothetical protein
MKRSIIEQHSFLDDDALAGLQARDDFHLVAMAGADLHVRGSKRSGPRSTITRVDSPLCSTAAAGTTMARRLAPENRRGRTCRAKVPSRLSMATRTFTVRVSGSSTRPRRRPCRRRLARPGVERDARRLAHYMRQVFSATLADSQTVDRSATVMTAR